MAYRELLPLITNGAVGVYAGGGSQFEFDGDRFDATYTIDKAAAFRLEFRARWTDTVGTDILVENGAGFAVFSSGGTIRCLAWSTSIDSGVTATEGEDYLIVVTGDGANVTLNVNGTEVSGSIGATANGSTFSIGGGASFQTFTGFIQDILLYGSGGSLAASYPVLGGYDVANDLLTDFTGSADAARGVTGSGGEATTVDIGSEALVPVLEQNTIAVAAPRGWTYPGPEAFTADGLTIDTSDRVEFGGGQFKDPGLLAAGMLFMHFRPGATLSGQGGVSHANILSGGISDADDTVTEEQRLLLAINSSGYYAYGDPSSGTVTAYAATAAAVASGADARVAIAWDGSNATLFVNGTKIGSPSITAWNLYQRLQFGGDATTVGSGVGCNISLRGFSQYDYEPSDFELAMLTRYGRPAFD